MLKHIVFSSFQASLIAAILFTLVSLHDFGVVALVFGAIAFAMAFVWCLLLSYPLIFFRRRYNFSEVTFFSVYCIVGFLAGSLTPIIIMSINFYDLSFQSIKLIGFYGLFGSLSAVIAWNYVRRKITVKNTYI